MIHRLSSQGTGKLTFAALAATTLVLGGCVTSRQIGDSGGGSEQMTTSGVSGASSTSGSGGASSTSSTGGESSTSGSGGAGGAQADNSIALLNSEISQGQGQDMWLRPGETLSPTTLIVIVSTEAQACSDPVFKFGTKNHRQVLIGLPQALQAVGKYDISSTDVIAFGDFWLGDGMGNGGGGMMPLTQGTVEVLSTDAKTITVRLAGLASDFTSLEGTDHEAARCP